MAVSAKHLIKNESRSKQLLADELETWCGESPWSTDFAPTSNPLTATCETCLSLAVEHGRAALTRLIAILRARGVPDHDMPGLLEYKPR